MNTILELNKISIHHTHNQNTNKKSNQEINKQITTHRTNNIRQRSNRFRLISRRQRRQRWRGYKTRRRLTRITIHFIIKNIRNPMHTYSGVRIDIRLYNQGIINGEIVRGIAGNKDGFGGQKSGDSGSGFELLEVREGEALGEDVVGDYEGVERVRAGGGGGEAGEGVVAGDEHGGGGGWRDV
ncbi:hypothetical protein Hanom_Chr01g00048171 [Helianthus anomalus]